MNEKPLSMQDLASALSEWSTVTARLDGLRKDVATAELQLSKKQEQVAATLDQIQGYEAKIRRIIAGIGDEK